MLQFWFTFEYRHEGAWREEWQNLTRWGKQVSQRCAAWTKKKFFLDERRQRFAILGQFSKGRMLQAAWRAGAPVGGFHLPLVGPWLSDLVRRTKMPNAPLGNLFVSAPGRFWVSSDTFWDRSL